ncbi:MAG: nucleotidyltransferase domain-containing protein [Nanoarchaeota archaeon]
MSNKQTKKILEEVLDNIKPSKQELEEIKKYLNDFLEKLNNSIKKNKINAEVFIGGSFSKNTLIKKEKYDIDIFVRFDKKYNDKEISNKLMKILSVFKSFNTVHGSRDYFSIKIKPELYFEIIPVKKIKKYQEAENVTDLSFFHVKYLNKKLKSQKILDEVRLAKAFCIANNCYGAESYIKGFSGYSLELLVYHYKSFINLIEKISKIKNKEIIDIEKHYKNKKNILIDLNSSKLKSPIILIDPTFKYRNALAALSNETFKEFQKACKNFLKKPSLSAFEKKQVNIENLKKIAQKNNYEFAITELKTNKQKGDIAGSKLFKFYKHLEKEITNYYNIKNKEFFYNENKKAICFFSVIPKKEIIHKGPLLSDKKNTTNFKKIHKNTYTKDNRIYSRESINKNLSDFLKNWKNKNKKKISQMNISDFKIIKNL